MERSHRLERGAESPRPADESLAESARRPGKRTLTETLVGAWPEAWTGASAAAPAGAHRSIQRAVPRAPSSWGVPAPAPDRDATAAVPEVARPAFHELFGGSVQLRAAAGTSAEEDTAAIHASAQQGIATAGSPLPYAETIQRSFGRYDISGVLAHTGPEAAASARAMGAQAYATGNHVVLGGGTDLHTVAHEAAHVVQQRGGVQLKGGVGEVGDAYERHADQVADAVVQGRSAEALLEQGAGGGSTSLFAGPPQQAAPIQMARPGEIEHVDNSCYAASILTLLAVVRRYAEAFDPDANVLDDGQDRGRTLQDAVHPLLVKVTTQTRITANEMDELVTVLHQLGLTIGERAEQQDAAHVMMGMLALVLTPGNRDHLQSENQETLTYDAQPDFPEITDHRQTVIQVGAIGCDTLEDALRIQFPTDGRMDDNHVDDGTHVENPHDILRKLTRLPEVLTISVTHANDRNTLDMPQELTIPADVVEGIDPLPRYRLRGFIMRNHSGGGGGHYVSYVEDDAHQWYHSNDMGGGPPSPEVVKQRIAAKKQRERERVAGVEPRVEPVNDMGAQRYGRLPAQSFALGHVYTYELVPPPLLGVAPVAREAFAPVALDALPELPQYRGRAGKGSTSMPKPTKPTRGRGGAKPDLPQRASPWVRVIDGQEVDLERLSVEQLVALLDAGRLFPRDAKAKQVDEPKPEPTVDEPKSEPTAFEPKSEPTVDEPTSEPTLDEPKAPAFDQPLLAYLTSRARNHFYETVNYVPGFDAPDGAAGKRAGEGPRPTQQHDERHLYQRAKEAGRTGSAAALAYLRVMDFRFTRGASSMDIATAEQRERVTEQALGKEGISEGLAAEYTGWQHARGELVDAQSLRGAGDALTRLVTEGASPKAIVDEIIVQCPELCEKYRVECASKGMRFYEHAQRVIDQYLKYFRQSEHPLVSVAAMVKAILFHDMDKKLARAAKSDRSTLEDDVRAKGFSGMPADKLGQRVGGKGKEAEHGLTRVMMQKYGGLWDNLDESLIVTQLVDGDPLGHMLQAAARAPKTIDKLAADALAEIEDMALRAGIARTDGDGIRDFYHHVKMFYQADSSSYSADSTAVSWDQRTAEEPEAERGDASSSLAGLYEPATVGEGYAKDEHDYLQMTSPVHVEALAALEALLAALPAAEEGTARDSVDERRGWEGVTSYQWSDFEIVEEIGKGSTKPLHVNDRRDGNKAKFLKLGMAHDPIHVMTESLTNHLYDEVGAPVPDFQLILIEGQPAMLSTWNDHHESPKSAAQLQRTDDFLTWVGADFIFGNFDLFKLDNWSIENRRMVRADNGGALDYRAQGNDRKDRKDWEDSGIEEQQSMRDFGAKRDQDPYKGLDDRRVAYSIIRVSDFLDEAAMERAFDAARCPAHRRAYLRSTLRSRLDQMTRWAMKQIGFEQIAIEAPRQPGESIFDCFFTGLSAMVRGVCCKDEPPPSHAEDEPVPIDHTSQWFADKQTKATETLLADLRRMRHGVLLRKCALQETAAYKAAASHTSPEERRRAVFGADGDPWKRGESVFSVNRIYTFDRDKANDKPPANDNTTTAPSTELDGHDASDEQAPLLGTDPTPDEAPVEPMDQTFSLAGALSWLTSKPEQSAAPSLQNRNYDYVVEIPITDQALEFLEQHFLVQGAKYEGPEDHPNKYKANPNLKYENTRGDDLPNVILRGHGWENIWSCFDRVRIYQPKQHIAFDTVPGSEDAERERLEEIARKIEAAKQEAALAKAEQERQRLLDEEEEERNPQPSLFSLFATSDDDQWETEPT